MIIAGIDGGGTGTRCLVVSDKLRLLAEAEGGPANYRTVGLDRAVGEVRTVFECALERSGVGEADLVGIGLAGVGADEDVRRVGGALFPLRGAGRSYLTDDATTAVLGSHAGRTGLAILAGTGSIACALTDTHELIRVGGWGPLLGDEGSGFWIGLRAMQAIARSNDGRLEETALEERVLKNLGFNRPWELVTFVHQEKLPRRRIAGLAPVVVEVMEDGDPVARQILTEAVEELVTAVDSAVKKYPGPAGRVATVGGLFRNDSFRAIFSERLRDRTGLLTARPRYSPAYGAIFFALRERGLPWSPPASRPGGGPQKNDGGGDNGFR